MTVRSNRLLLLLLQPPPPPLSLLLLLLLRLKDGCLLLLLLLLRQSRLESSRAHRPCLLEASAAHVRAPWGESVWAAQVSSSGAQIRRRGAAGVLLEQEQQAGRSCSGARLTSRALSCQSQAAL